MRKIFSAIVVFLVLFGVHRETLAQTSSLEAFAVGENISISYTSTNSAVVQPMISDKEISAIPPSLVIAPGLEPKLSGLSQKTSWQTKKTLDPAIVYYVRIFDTSSKVFLTENIKINTEYSTISLGNFNLEKQNTGTYGFYGNIDIKKHAENSLVPYSSIKVSGDITTKKTGEKIMGLGNPVTVDEKGEYRFLVINNSFDPNGWYLANLTFESDKGVSTTKSYDFNIKKGVIPETGKEADNFYDSNSYRLLAPIPGMTALLDPELCKLRQQSNPGEICDINAFLNFILKLIIGIAAVILVVRIIITGYGYMLTDVPFVKAKLKGGFRDALLGLIFALASYVILNTINPRLVNNDFSIGVAEFEATAFKELGINYGNNEVSFEKIGPEGASCDENIKPAKINFSGKAYKYIKSDYIPAQDRALPNIPKGTKALMTVQTMVEGFYPTTKSFKTNNPGNIGNTDIAPKNWTCSSAGIRCFPTLDAGIKAQADLQGDKNYKIGRVVKTPGGIGDDNKRYPPLNFIYDGSICQYLAIYSTGARHNTSYMSTIMGYFESVGLKITPRTKLSDIYKMM